MNENNTVTIVSNNAKIIDEITSSLVLLRDFDKVESTNSIDAFDFLLKELPQIIILHVIFDDNKRLELLRKISLEPRLKNSVVIMLLEDCSEEFLMEAFSFNVSDFVSYPFKTSELLLRVMWSTRKSEMLKNIDLRSNFLTNLGIIDYNSGFYSKKYSEEFLQNEIEYSIRQKEVASLMLVNVTDKKEKSKLNFPKILKKSLRLNDSVCIFDKNKYYVFLPKTKLNGAYSVFDRIKEAIVDDFKINSSVVEIKDKPFSKIKELLVNSINNNISNNNTLIVATNAVSINEDSMVISDEKEDEVCIDSDKIKEEFERQIKNVMNESSDFKIKNDKLGTLKLKAKDVLDIRKSKEEKEIEERNANIYKQAFERKCTLVIEPIFKKYKSLLLKKNKFTFVDYKIDFQNSSFKVIKGANELDVNIEYNGLSSIKISIVHIFNTRIKDAKTMNVELFKFDRKNFEDLFEQIVEVVNI